MKNSLTSEILLRDVEEDDLPAFFEHQSDPVASHMAAFIARDPADKDAFAAHWTKIMGDDTVVIKTIVFGADVAGHIAKFESFGKPEVTYWIARTYWGKGIATKALTLFLIDLKTRPLYARAAKDNVASIRVLHKCGFVTTGYDRGFAQARGQEIEEAILQLT